MRVLFILDYSFPCSTAPSNRISSLVKAIKLTGNAVSVISINGSYRTEKEATENVQDYTDVIFCTSKFRSDNFLIRNIYKVKGFFNSILVILKENRKEKIDYIFLPVRKNIYNSILILLAKFKKIKLLQERSELPEIYERSFIKKIGSNYYKRHIVTKLFGMVVMTNALKQYYSKFISIEDRIVIVPMSVDMQRFEKSDRKVRDESYIAYCGNVSNIKDGVDILIKAFALISERHDIKLYIIGDSTEKNTISGLKELTENLGITGKVVFTGRVGADKIPELLCSAEVLALARPSSLQAAGGFPTKLGEYLATKNPVVVTETGEITFYLKDGESAYIAKPDSPKDFADKLDQCLSDPETAREIGVKGYEVASNFFDYRKQSELLNSFFVRNS